jgi:hypothetical protein
LAIFGARFFVTADFLGLGVGGFARLVEVAATRRDVEAARLGDESLTRDEERAAALAVLWDRVRLESDSLIPSPLQRNLPTQDSILHRLSGFYITD